MMTTTTRRRRLIRRPGLHRATLPNLDQLRLAVSTVTLSVETVDEDFRFVECSKMLITSQARASIATSSRFFRSNRLIDNSNAPQFLFALSTCTRNAKHQHNRISSSRAVIMTYNNFRLFSNAAHVGRRIVACQMHARIEHIDARNVDSSKRFCNRCLCELAIADDFVCTSFDRNDDDDVWPTIRIRRNVIAQHRRIIV
jgi:hypothetical protein